MAHDNNNGICQDMGLSRDREANRRNGLFLSKQSKNFVRANGHYIEFRESFLQVARHLLCKPEGYLAPMVRFYVVSEHHRVEIVNHREIMGLTYPVKRMSIDPGWR